MFKRIQQFFCCHYWMLEGRSEQDGHIWEHLECVSCGKRKTVRIK